MKMSAGGRKVLAEREGVRLKAYRDQVGVWTIGIGHTAAAGAPAPKAGLTITAAECDAILTRDLALFEAAVSKAVKVEISQNAFDALVSLAFNIGATAFVGSSVVRRLNAGDRASTGEAILLWNKAGGKINAGLVARRKAERAQFLEPDPAVAPTPWVAPTPSVCPTCHRALAA